jgi:Mg-chelatase subunit ChlD
MMKRVLAVAVAAAVTMTALALPVAPSEGQGPQNISVVLAIDNSGSMARTDPAGLRFAAASQLVDLLEEGDEISVILFDDDSDVLVPLTRLTDAASREGLKASLSPIVAAGNTNMRAGLEAARAELERGTNSVSFAIFLTDGELQPPGWEDLSAQQQDAERQAVLALAGNFGERGWDLFPVSLASAVEPEFLEALAERGGGFYKKAAEASELALVFQEVFAANKLDVFEILFSDCLAPEDQKSISLPVHPFVSSLSMFVTYTSDLRPVVTVSRPSGEQVTPTAAYARYDAYIIQNPARGSWTIRIAGAGESESCVSISSTPRTLAEVEWLRPPSSVSLNPGDPLEIAVRLTAADPQTQDTRPVEDATVTVTVTGPAGQQFEGVLAHTGGGEYAGPIDVTGEAGAYSIALVAETEEGVVARRTLEVSVSAVAQTPEPSPTPKAGPPSPGSERGGRSTLLILGLFSPVVVVGLAASFLAYARLARPTLQGWLVARGQLESLKVGRAYDLARRHRRTWTRRAVTIGGPNDDIDLGLGRRVARLIPQRDRNCALQALKEDVVTVDGQLLKKGQCKRLDHGTQIDLGGVPLTFREEIG